MRVTYLTKSMNDVTSLRIYVTLLHLDYWSLLWL